MSRQGKVWVIGYTRAVIGILLAAVLPLGWGPPAAGQAMPTLDVVIGNNFGHLPMFVGVHKGFFRIPEQFDQSFQDEVQRAYPQYFSDLGPLPADAR